MNIRTSQSSTASVDALHDIKAMLSLGFSFCVLICLSHTFPGISSWHEVLGGHSMQSMSLQKSQHSWSDDSDMTVSLLNHGTKLDERSLTSASDCCIRF